MTILLLRFNTVLAGERVSIEGFKKIHSRSERQEAIDIHLSLIASYGSEEALTRKKENMAARARGFSSMEGLFVTQTHYWESNITGVVEENKKSGMANAEEVEVEKKFSLTIDNLIKRRLIVHSLAFNMAASPGALTLEKTIERLKKGS